jgi:hypothetical protein
MKLNLLPSPLAKDRSFPEGRIPLALNVVRCPGCLASIDDQRGITMHEIGKIDLSKLLGFRHRQNSQS